MESWSNAHGFLQQYVTARFGWSMRLPYLSIRCTPRLALAGIEPSVGRRGDSYENARAETIIGLYTTAVIHHDGPWRGRDHVAYATRAWVSWYNTPSLMEPLGDVPPAEFDAPYHTRNSDLAELVLK